MRTGVCSHRIRLLLVSAAFWLGGFVAVMGVGASVLSVLDARAIFDMAGAVQVGMTEADVLLRLGSPTLRISAGTDSVAQLRRGGYWLPTRKIEGELLAWEFGTPSHCWYRLYVYIGVSGVVECVTLGNT